MPTALITGASTGIGRELATLFAADHEDLVLVASPRSHEALTVTAHDLAARYGVTAHAIAIDLAAPDAAEQLDERIAALGVDVDHLVNNAGFGIVGLKLQDYDPEQVTRMLRVNVQALTDLTVRFAPRMIERGHGAVLNVSSIAGYIVPHGLEAAYAASKAYVRSFSESAAHDLRGTGVSCTHLAPGPTRTEFFRTGGLQDDGRVDRLALDATTVARAGYDAMRAGRTSVMPGFGNRALRVASALSPSRRLVGAISGYFVTRR